MTSAHKLNVKKDRVYIPESTLAQFARRIIVVLLTYFTYFALALRATPGFEDMATITGELVAGCN